MNKDIKYLCDQQHKMRILLSRMCLVTYFTIYQPIKKRESFLKGTKGTDANKSRR